MNEYLLFYRRLPPRPKTHIRVHTESANHRTSLSTTTAKHLIFSRHLHS